MDDPQSSPSIPLADPPVVSMPPEPVQSLPQSDHDKESVKQSTPVPSVSTPPAPPELPPEPPPSAVTDQPSSHYDSVRPHRKGGKGAIFAVILILFIVLPLSVMFVSSRNQVSDVRSRAASNDLYFSACNVGNTQDCAFGSVTNAAGDCACNPNPYVTVNPDGGTCGGTNVCATGHWCVAGKCQATLPSTTTTTTTTGTSTKCKTGPGFECCIGDTTSCGGNTEACHCLGGDACTSTTCDYSLGASCRNWGRSWCDNYQGYGKTCCEVGYTCCGSTDGCCSGGGPITTNTTTPHNTSTPGDNTPIPTSPPGVTSTPTPIPQQCQAIKLYKDGVLVTDYSTVHAGDTVVVAVAAGTAAKARVRINGAAWQETTTKNANNEFVVTLTVPTGVTSVTVEAEIFADGVWK